MRLALCIGIASLLWGVLLFEMFQPALTRKRTARRAGGKDASS